MVTKTYLPTYLWDSSDSSDSIDSCDSSDRSDSSDSSESSDSNDSSDSSDSIDRKTFFTNKFISLKKISEHFSQD